MARFFESEPNIFDQKAEEKKKRDKLAAQSRISATSNRKEQARQQQLRLNEYVDSLRIEPHNGTKPSDYFNAKDARLCEDFIKYMARKRFAGSTIITELAPENYRKDSLMGRLGLVAAGNRTLWQTRAYQIGKIDTVEKNSRYSYYRDSRVYLCEDGLMRAAVKPPQSPAKIEQYLPLPNAEFTIETGEHITKTEITGWRSIGATWSPPADARPAGDVYEAPNYRDVTRFYPTSLEQILEAKALS